MNPMIRLRKLHDNALQCPNGTKRTVPIVPALIVKYADGKEKITFNSIADKWGVSHTQIGYDRDRIFRMIREAIEEARKEQE